MEKIDQNTYNKAQNQNLKYHKRLVIGDIHGHLEPFKTIYENEDPDDVIVLGDYFDSFHGTDQEIIDCFKEIVKMKDNHQKGEFILLIGNHDFHYIDLSETYSGKRQSYALQVSVMLDKLIDEKKIKYVYADYINKVVYSHAGITNKWLESNRLFISDLDELNDIDPRKYRFTFKGDDSGYETGYGDGPYASPIWVRPNTLAKDMYIDLDDYKWTQIVGHTHGNAKVLDIQQNWNYGIQLYDNKTGTIDESIYQPLIYVIDSLPNYYIVELLDDSGVLVSREVKAINIEYDEKQKKDKEIKDLAKLCGINLTNI